MNSDSAVTRFGKPRRRRSLVASAACAWLFTLCFSVLLLLMLAIVAYKSDDPTRNLVPFSIGALAASSLACGIAGARFRRGQGLIAGLLSGLVFALSVALLSLAFAGVSSPTLEKTYLLYVAIPLISGFGGMLACLRGQPKKSAKRRNR